MGYFWQQRTGAARLVLLLPFLMAASVHSARPLPKLAQPDYTLYHTKCAGKVDSAVLAPPHCFRRLPPLRPAPSAPPCLHGLSTAACCLQGRRV